MGQFQIPRPDEAGAAVNAKKGKRKRDRDGGEENEKESGEERTFILYCKTLSKPDESVKT